MRFEGFGKPRGRAAGGIRDGDFRETIIINGKEAGVEV